MQKSDKKWYKREGCSQKVMSFSQDFSVLIFFCDSIFLRQVTIKSYPRGFLHLIQLYYQHKWIIIPPFYQHGLLICVFISGASAVILKDKVVILKLGCIFVRNVFLTYKISRLIRSSHDTCLIYWFSEICCHLTIFNLSKNYLKEWLICKNIFISCFSGFYCMWSKKYSEVNFASGSYYHFSWICLLLSTYQLCRL